MTFDESLVTDYWHLICHRSEVSRAGDYVRIETSVGDIVVLNDGAGVIAFDNRCPHRGARFYSEVSGNRTATCPYHGWTHRSGRMFVARKERFSSCDLSNARLRQFRAEWVADFLFVGISPRMELAQQLGSHADMLRSMSKDIVARFDFNHYDYNCYWPIAIENALEPYHIDAIHPETLATLQLEDGVNDLGDWSSVWSAPVGSRKMQKQLKAIGSLFSLVSPFPGYQSIYLFPFTMISSTYGYSYSLQNFFPLDKNRTNFLSRMLVSRTKSEQAPQMLSSFFSSSAELNRRVFDEDHEICKIIPYDAWSAEPLNFSADSEAKIQHFRKMCRRHSEWFK